MEFNDSIELTKIALLVSLVIFCSITDLSMRRIPNAVLLPAFLTALFLNTAVGGPAGLVDSLAGLTLGLLMLMPLHILGRMGAGDIKLLGVVGSILGGWGAIVAGLATMMAGGILGLAYMVWLFVKPGVVSRITRLSQRMAGRVSVTQDDLTWQTVRAAEIPYAVAIAAGTFATLAYLGLLSEVSIT